MKTIFNKHKYIKVYTFTPTKKMKVNYYKTKNFKPNFLINSDHIFDNNGYTSLVIQENGNETINPLNFKSKYDAEKFQIAIDNKLMKDTYATLKPNQLDLTKVLLFIMLGINLLLLYNMLKSNGVI